MSQEENKEFEMAVGTSSILESNIMDGGENFYTPMESATEPEPAAETNWNVLKNDTGQLCRSCANSSDYLIPIYEGEGLEHQLEYKIQKHLPIQVSSTDTLPLQLCYQCASTLIAWDSMINSCIEADKKLRAMQEAAEEVKQNQSTEDSQADADNEANAEPEVADSDDEPLIASKSKLLSEKNVVDKEATPLKKKILSKTKSKSVTAKTEKTVQVSKEGDDKERSAMLSILDRIKQENDEFEDEKQVLDSADLRDLFESNTEKLFRCNVCLKSFSKITSYEAHLRIHTGETEMVCHICEARFVSLQELKSHVSTHSRSNSVFPCKLCGHVFPTLAAMKRHKLVHLHANEWTCEICSRKFRQHSYYIDHILMHKLKKDLNEKFTCIDCGTVFDDEKLFFDHQKTHSKEVKMEEEDEECEVILVAVDKKQLEEQQNGTDLSTETTIPSEMALLNDEYTIIELQASEGNEFICGECGKECSDLDSVSAHMATHNKEEQYECGECKLVFPYKYALLQHTRTHHTDHRPYTCDVCAASFATKNGLRNHRTIHLSLRYPCDECGNVFKGRSGLYLHKQRVHRGRKDFACDYCGKLFALKCQRDNHRRVHTGEKPYKCEICGAGFKAQSGLYVHRKTHTDERPYKCDICGKHLRLPYNLRLHMRTHTGEKPYVCDICGRAFSQPGDCKKHKKIHQKNMEEKNSLDSIDPGSIVQEKSEFPGIGYI